MKTTLSQRFRPARALTLLGALWTAASCLGQIPVEWSYGSSHYVLSGPVQEFTTYAPDPYWLGYRHVIRLGPGDYSFEVTSSLFPSDWAPYLGFKTWTDSFGIPIPAGQYALIGRVFIGAYVMGQAGSQEAQYPYNVYEEDFHNFLSGANNTCAGTGASVGAHDAVNCENNPAETASVTFWGDMNCSVCASPYGIWVGLYGYIWPLISGNDGNCLSEPDTLVQGWAACNAIVQFTVREPVTTLFSIDPLLSPPPVIPTGGDASNPGSGASQTHPQTPDATAPPAANGCDSTPSMLWTNVASGHWLELPMPGPRYVFTADDGALFTAISNFPSGALFEVEVAGQSQGVFTNGYALSFSGFPGGGVTQFAIAPVGPTRPGRYPIPVMFDGPTAQVEGRAASPSPVVALLRRLGPAGGTSLDPTNALADGESARLEAVVAGGCNNNYQWRRGGTALAGATQSSLAFPSFALAQSGVYTVTVSNELGLAESPSMTLQGAPVFVPGVVVHRKYSNVSDGAGYPVEALFGDPRFPNQPDRRDLMGAFEYPANLWRDSAADPARDYFDSLDGYFIPPQSGNYVFFLSFDDRCGLWLSTDESPVNRHKIAEQQGWTDARNWTVGHSTVMSQARSDEFVGTEWPEGNSISLVGGQKYFMLLVHHDPSWAGGDWFGATYKRAADADPAPGSASTLAGGVVGAFVDPNGTTVSFTRQPANAAVPQGGTTALSAAATGVSPYGFAVAYQWQSAPKGGFTFTNIPAATSRAYAPPPLALSDDGRKFRVIASIPPISLTSSVATATVTDAIPPLAVSVGAMLDPGDGGVEVGVGFDEPVDDAAGSAVANYTVSSGSIASLQWFTNRFTADSLNPLAMVRKQNALLKLAGFSGATGSLTLSNLKDGSGNPMSPLTLPFTVDTRSKWAVVGANQFGGWNAAVPVGAGGWDVYSDGMAEWGGYDEATFVYEPVTGDFDKRLRVRYQDGSSAWARAGLIVRDALNFGVDQVTQQSGAAGRFQKCLVDPVGAVLTGPGNPGSALWEGNRRLNRGGACDSALGSNNATPLYPNAWCRIQRSGQTFTLYRSDDGVNWLELGATTWGVDDPAKTPMPDTVFVGPEFSPENGNISLAEDRGTFLAQFRDYGDYQRVDVTPQVAITRSGFRLNRATGTYVQIVSLRNIGASDIAGPVALFLDGLGANAALFNSANPAGVPDVLLNTRVDGLFSRGETVTLTLQFTNPGNQAIAYQPRVTAGSASSLPVSHLTNPTAQ